MNLATQLADGLAALGVSLPDETQARLLQYLALIRKWNRVHNLTAMREPEMILIRHLFDSLAILPHIAGSRIVDVGSGAGLPGIPLALVRPEWQVVLLESNHKKAVFLQQARIELKLNNVEIVAERVENFRSASGFDTVISRAFSDLADFVKLAGHLAIEGGGRLAAMKGVYPHEELAQLPPPFVIENVFPVVVPGLEAKRHLVMIKPGV
ncbi:16S rRNA m(7)G-527 methyltransferase [Nitrosospira sp. Nsp5]|uniref:Ribosomal RNA small subunit methyltransferase G n=1 Tax=Nitrosospira multiformis TaxID=1231 RepID=A0ABY0T6S6_9PROT|nr:MULTISPECIES: 16S rRNA (guanine(527)-N(7))-methyltransferase RsmG [Nitrosospira]PTR07196.1 16S rRNA m(7)G-527 methyltransferase [Nitrosospira sp. Nsp5]SDQ35622.1 16S rRNA m(7)G-527 methyltransferase [Nitrosospira multiformis]